MSAALQSAARPLRVALLWNGAVHDERLLLEPAKVVLGEGRGATFPLPEGATTEDSVTLLEPVGSGYRLQPAKGMAGAVWLAGQRTDVRGLREPVQLGGGDYGVVSFGSTSLFFQHVRAVEGEPPRKQYRDGALIGCIGLSVFAHVAAMLFFFVVAAQELAPVSELELDSELLRKFLVVPPPQDVIEAARASAAEQKQRLSERDEAAAKRANKEQGKLGRRDATRNKTEIAGAPADQIAQQVRGLGLLGVLAGGRSNAVSTALNTTSLDSLLGGLGAAQTSIGHGSGLSTRGSGPGGGGQGTGVTFGAGNLGTAVAGGKGPGRGGKGLGDGHGAREAQLSLGAEGAHVSGFLSPEQINRVVQANRAAIKYCFETALQRQPNLQGAITAGWRIDRKGLVTTVRVAKSTLGDPGVEGCILRQIKRWKFPEPDGGEVDVLYPFLFGRS
ncbi:MAG: AgmX/PglI C-terminal domain-containing protein [Polyangiales bacterium]